MSRHRTLDPEEADFFYVPVLSTCWFHPVSGELMNTSLTNVCPLKQGDIELGKAGQTATNL